MELQTSQWRLRTAETSSALPWKLPRNWRNWGVTLGQVSVDSEEVRFVLQEWDAVKSADGSHVRVPTRRLAYRVPRVATQPPVD